VNTNKLDSRSHRADKKKSHEGFAYTHAPNERERVGGEEVQRMEHRHVGRGMLNIQCKELKGGGRENYTPKGKLDEDLRDLRSLVMEKASAGRVFLSNDSNLVRDGKAETRGPVDPSVEKQRTCCGLSSPRDRLLHCGGQNTLNPDGDKFAPSSSTRPRHPVSPRPHWKAHILGIMMVRWHRCVTST